MGGGIPVINTVPFLRPHYLMRALFGSMIMVSAILQAYNIVRTFVSDGSRKHRHEIDDYVAAA